MTSFICFQSFSCELCNFLVVLKTQPFFHKKKKQIGIVCEYYRACVIQAPKYTLQCFIRKLWASSFVPHRFQKESESETKVLETAVLCVFSIHFFYDVVVSMRSVLNSINKPNNGHDCEKKHLLWRNEKSPSSICLLGLMLLRAFKQMKSSFAYLIFKTSFWSFIKWHQRWWWKKVIIFFSIKKTQNTNRTGKKQMCVFCHHIIYVLLLTNALLCQRNDERNRSINLQSNQTKTHKIQINKMREKKIWIKMISHNCDGILLITNVYVSLFLTLSLSVD